jgi:NADPH-dependent 2,4-dienoyl-CoA reductase/sulfur reductase-like enzyme/rhodanese-related sulfurtransferase
MKTVIVGGVAAGASTAARLRRLDESAEVVILERDHFVSFANCGLPYHIGGEIPERDSLLLQTPESLKSSLALDVRTGQEVTRIDRGAKQVEVRDLDEGGSYRERYDKLVLCPGATPIRLPIPGGDDPSVDVLRNIPDMDKIIAQIEKDASSAVVIGGSYIGLEMAENLKTRGLATTVVERTTRLMPWLDPEMTRILDYHVEANDVNLRLDTSATAVRREKDNPLFVDLSDGTSVPADVIVMAVGVRPNVELARDAGLEIGPLGGIVVDAHMQTSDPDILAAGDAVETPNLLTGAPTLSMLAGPANREGRVAADTICGRDSAYRGTQGSAVVKVFDMTAGGTGLTERELLEAGIDYRKVYTHQNGHAAYYPGTAPLFLKVLFSPDGGRLLGAQVLGWDGVDKRIDVLAVAIRAGMTVFDLEHVELAYAPPYGAAKDPINMAGFLGSNLLRGDIDLWYAEDFPGCRGKVTILDVRTQAEYDMWHIPDAVLIPYTELRDRLSEVPRDKPVYVYCRSGFRSYIAYCVLKQNGWDDVAFLSGGAMTYHGYHRTPLGVGKGGMPVIEHAEEQLAQEPAALAHV